jgi:hypothetical protein
MLVNGSKETVKKVAGRPKKYGGGSVSVKRRNITVTDDGWDGLDVVVLNNGLGSRSELVEQIGRKNLQVLPAIDAREIPVLPRLDSFINKETYMRSLLSFARLVCLRTGITKELDDNSEEIIEKVVLRAITFVALRDYVYPGNLVNSALADIRWLVFKLLLSEKNIHSQVMVTEIDEIINKYENPYLNSEIEQIFDSVYLFSRSYSLEYQIYEMRMMESLTWEQIHRLFSIRGSRLTEEEIRYENCKAVNAIREAWHSLHLGTLKGGDPKSPGKEKLQGEMSSTLKMAQGYYDLINSEEISAEQWKDWEAFLLKCMKQPRLDLLLPEIHHSWVHRQMTTERMEIHKDKSTKIIEKIKKSFRENLEKELSGLKQKLQFCGNKRQDIQDALMTTISRPQQIDEIPTDYFLGARAIENQHCLVKV